MRKRNTLSILRWVSLSLIFIAIAVLGIELVLFSRIRANLPLDLTIADVPVGGLTSSQAGERLIQAYGVPIELVYGTSQIQVSPASIGFSLNLETMLAAADLQRNTQNFWVAFMGYLWNTPSEPLPVPLSADVSEERLRAYLENEIVPRYDTPATAPMPQSGTAGFSQGEAGRKLNVDQSIQLIMNALRSPTNRVVSLPYDKTTPSRASTQSLQYMVHQILQTNNFDGVAEFYLLDLEKRDELSFAFSNLESIPPDIAFTAASTIKVPIMIYTYAYRDMPLSDAMQQQMESMIEVSQNTPADELLRAIGGTTAPVSFTNDMEKLGLKNTYLAGFFYNGASLLFDYKTPANTRTDVNTNPDRYNQTVPAEIAELMDDIYQCSVYNGGTLKAVYGDQITQDECTNMLTMLSKNKTGVLLEAGIPETVKVAHKHGWILSDDGLIHNISDVGIIYSPGATYIFAMFYYHPTQLVFDPTNVMASQISKVVYQYYNPNSQ